MGGKRTSVTEQCLESFKQLRTEGQEWVYAPDLAQRAASLDERYVRRRKVISKMFGLVGIEKPIIPYFPRVATVYVAFSKLSSEGVIESRFEEGEYPQRRVYRLITADGESA